MRTTLLLAYEDLISLGSKLERELGGWLDKAEQLHSPARAIIAPYPLLDTITLMQKNRLLCLVFSICANGVRSYLGTAT